MKFNWNPCESLWKSMEILMNLDEGPWFPDDLQRINPYKTLLFLVKGVHLESQWKSSWILIKGYDFLMSAACCCWLSLSLSLMPVFAVLLAVAATTSKNVAKADPPHPWNFLLTLTLRFCLRFHGGKPEPFSRRVSQHSSQPVSQQAASQQPEPASSQQAASQQPETVSSQSQPAASQ